MAPTGSSSIVAANFSLREASVECTCFTQAEACGYKNLILWSTSTIFVDIILLSPYSSETAAEVAGMRTVLILLVCVVFCMGVANAAPAAPVLRDAYSNDYMRGVYGRIAF